MNKTVAVITQDFSTGGNSFRRGEFYIAEPDDDRSRGGWLTITNLNFEYKTTIPMGMVCVVNHASLVELSKVNLLSTPLVDRSQGSLTKAT